MKVTLIEHTENALALLLYTKNTRLMGAESLESIENWPEKKQLEELSYMKDTIKSSWEFVNYTFHIKEISRAFTHQFVRTRTGHYAQQSQRTVDVRDNGYLIPYFEDDDGFFDDLMTANYKSSMDFAFTKYEELIDNGANIQDARGLLPTNAFTEIIGQFSLRTLHEMAQVRLCTRTQGEYQSIFRAMRDAVIEVHPWAEDFIQVACAWSGVCAFPRYSQCPIQKYTYNSEESEYQREDLRRLFPMHDEVIQVIKTEWEKTDHEAVPVSQNGKTM